MNFPTSIRVILDRSEIIVGRQYDDCIAILNYPNKIHIIPGTTKFGSERSINHNKYYTLEFKLPGKAEDSSSSLRGDQPHLVEVRWSEGLPGSPQVLVVRSSAHQLWFLEVAIPEHPAAQPHRGLLDGTDTKESKVVPGEWVASVKGVIDLGRQGHRKHNTEVKLTSFMSSYVNGVHLNMDMKTLMVVFNTVYDSSQPIQRFMVAVFYTLNDNDKNSRWEFTQQSDQSISLPCIFDERTYDVYENLKLLAEDIPLISSQKITAAKIKAKQDNQLEFLDCLYSSPIQVVENLQTVSGVKQLNLSFIIRNATQVYHLRIKNTDTAFSTEIFTMTEPLEEEEKKSGLNYLLKVPEKQFLALTADEKEAMSKVYTTFITDA